MNTYRIVMSRGPRSEKKIEGERFVISEDGKLLIYKGGSNHATSTAPISDQEVIFVANIGEWVSIEVA